MRIIKLGNHNIIFKCQHCETEFEINTCELTYDESQNYWFIKCPLCEEILWLGDNYYKQFMERRRELSKDIAYKKEFGE